MSSSSDPATEFPSSLPRVDEEEEQLMRNFGEHKLMERVQETLRKQLETQLSRVDADVRAVQEASDAAARRREDVGVELYGVQQQLAALQTSLDTRDGTLGATAARRAANEAAIERYSEAARLRAAGIAEAEARLEALRGELDGVTDTVRQLSAYAEEAGGDIAVAKRSALKAEVATREGEKAKLVQDAYINGLMAAVRKAGLDAANLQERLEMTRGEGGQAASTLAEAAAEMETIRLEKKQLMLQWQSTLNALRRRDEALALIARTLMSSQAEIDAMSAEAGNLKKQVLAAQGVHAKVSDSLEREEADLRQTESATQALMRQGVALAERRAALASTVEANEDETKRSHVETGRYQKVAKELDNERSKTDRARFGLEDEINDALSSRVTNEKASKAQLKEAGRLLERSHALDLGKAEAENQVASARVEALTQSARLAALRDQLSGLVRGVDEKEALAVKCEIEIRQRSEAVQKKMSIVDRLNRKWEKLVAGMPTEDNVGPLAAEVLSLSKSIAESRVEAEALQKRWLIDQTALVGVETEAEVRRARLSEVGSELTLLRQKQLRLDRAINGETSEGQRLEAAVKGMRDDMTRINALISKNSGLRERLSVEAYALEQSFGEELKDIERDFAGAEARTRSLKNEGARILNDLVEAEKQVLAWEKKIGLEKELQDAIDPSVGESENQSMEKEVHRLRLRHDALKRDQERIIAEMERAVAKRDVIAQKSRSARQAMMDAAAQTGKGLVAALGGSARLLSSGLKSGKSMEGDAVTKVGLAHKAAALRSELAARLVALEEAETGLTVARADGERVASRVAGAEGEQAVLEEAAARAQQSLRGALFARARAAEQANSAERMLARFIALEAGRLPSVAGGAAETAAVRSRAREAEAAALASAAVCAELKVRHPDLAGAIVRIQSLLAVRVE